MHLRSAVTIFALVLAGASYAWAETPALETSSDLVVSISAKSLERRAMALEVHPGPVAENAIRVYSEPSHTLLALVADPDFLKSPEGADWYAAEVEGREARAQATTKLPGSRPKLVFLAPPEGDDRIAVWVHGTWPDGAGDRLVANTNLGGEISFSTYLTEDAGDRGGFVWRHCCDGSGCSQAKCEDCPSAFFTCCVLPGCCSISCGLQPACTCADCGC